MRWDPDYDFYGAVIDEFRRLDYEPAGQTGENGPWFIFNYESGPSGQVFIHYDDLLPMLAGLDDDTPEEEIDEHLEHLRQYGEAAAEYCRWADEDDLPWM